MEFGYLLIGDKGSLRLFEQRTNMLKQCVRMFNLASIWISQRGVWSNHYERVNEARVNRY